LDLPVVDFRFLPIFEQLILGEDNYRILGEKAIMRMKVLAKEKNKNECSCVDSSLALALVTTSRHRLPDYYFTLIYFLCLNY
jgi:hypothetical protein